MSLAEILAAVPSLRVVRGRIYWDGLIPRAIFDAIRNQRLAVIAALTDRAAATCVSLPSWVRSDQAMISLVEQGMDIDVAYLVVERRALMVSAEFQAHHDEPRPASELGRDHQRPHPN